jgi:hypothetical protein
MGDFGRIVNSNGVGSPMLGLVVLATAPRKGYFFFFFAFFFGICCMRITVRS